MRNVVHNHNDLHQILRCNFGTMKRTSQSIHSCREREIRGKKSSTNKMSRMSRNISLNEKL
jgi:ribosomal protein L37AE/L43A